MKRIAAYGSNSSGDALSSLTIARRDLRPEDVEIEIHHCGVCHSDLHQVRDEWGGAIFPMVPGHEIIGRITAIGTGVTRFHCGDLVGVGCLIDSCQVCASCKDGYEQYCEKGFSPTYNGYEQDGVTPTYGGYSEMVVVDQAFVLRIPANLDPAGAAPLLCAGITTYSPLRHWGIDERCKIGIIGLGGLGHMGVKFGAAMRAQVVAITSSASKIADARRLGADDALMADDFDSLAKHMSTFDFILDTVSAPHDLARYLNLLKRDGALCLVGAPPDALALNAFDIVLRRRAIAGSLIGGLGETQEMLDFCGQHGIVSDIEAVAMADIEVAYQRMTVGDVKYRFVVDMKTLPGRQPLRS